ncbi:helix-turn-helix transcriptional regulator [Clostridium sp. CF012]|uniref:helix-turn-helix domain-containing protein n=1 Tax=Clostridium sp. CF012 TaxID=2843319 RepID=UPI001C0E2659|nr:helix-turn-helix transcriptional regulator [Clostridium sp. CF012]MBU3142241.1 helix-turn-helix transcriptional regulator [Clostridium sp. CF012]
MNWKLFSSELKQQMNSVGISGRTLSEKINKSPSYINQILNGRVRKVEWETSRKIYEQLNLIDIKLLDYYLYLMGVELPDDINNNVINSNMIKNVFTLEQCYKAAWVTQTKEDSNNADIPSASDFYTEEELEENEVLRSFVSNKEMDYNSDYSFNKKKEMEDTINQISEKLTSLLEESFDTEDYSKNHSAEEVLTTLRGLFNIDNNNPTIYRFFLRLLSIPLHTVTNVNLQKEIIYSLEKLCQSKYEFNKLSDIDNDPVNTNYLSVEPK